MANYNPALLETVSCLCNSTKPPRRTIPARDEGSGEVFDYLVCHDCGLERLSPRPLLERIGSYYPAHYAPFTVARQNTPADRFKRVLYEVFWSPEDEVRPGLITYRSLFRILLRPFKYRTIMAFPPPTIRRVYEFGAARAVDLLAFRAAGWFVEGCEPSAQACQLAAQQGIKLEQTTAESASLPDSSYSCILFNNVFEHVHDPITVMAKCRRALLPNGLLVLVVPNHASWTGRLFGAAWPGYDAPRHLWGWTPASIRHHLEENGFTLQSIHHEATGAWLWKSTLDGRHSPLAIGRIRTWLSRHASALGIPFSVLASMMKHGDFMRIIASRNG